LSDLFFYNFTFRREPFLDLGAKSPPDRAYMSFLAPAQDRRVALLHLRNLLQALLTTSLKAMELRALLFSSDGASNATLCQVLTDLEIEADIC